MGTQEDTKKGDMPLLSQAKSCICGNLRNIYKPKKLPDTRGKSGKRPAKTLEEQCIKHTTGAEISRLQKVSFGTSGERSMYPMSIPTDKFSSTNRQPPPGHGATHLGPGTYDTETYTRMQHSVKPAIIGSKGYVLGARTAPQITPLAVKNSALGYPGPARYQRDLCKYDFRPAKKPFGVASVRSKTIKDKEVTPGPARYNTIIPDHTRVRHQQSFGGTPFIALPPPPVKSLIAPNVGKFPSSMKHRLYHRKLKYLKLYY